MNADCSEDRPLCNPATNVCVECANTGDCPTGQICRADATCGACQNNRDCGGATPFCHPLIGLCVACSQDGDCGGGTVCNEAAGRCVVPAAICDDDADCGVGRACDALFQQCYSIDGTCNGANDCRPMHRCENNIIFGRRCLGCGIFGLPVVSCPERQFCFFDACNPIE